MKRMTLQLKSLSIFCALLIFAACSGGVSETSDAQDQSNQASTSVEGSWNLISFESNGSSEKFKECDAQTTWHFTGEDAAPLSDGTAAKKIVASAPEDCNFFGFESTWAMLPQNQLFIASTRVGGTGGASNAGLFDIEELSQDKLVLKAMSNIYTFER